LEAEVRKRLNPALLAVFVFVLLVSVMMPVAASASSYYSVITYFTIYLRGATRSYTHDDMNINLYSTAQPTYITTYTIELWRDVFGSDDYIGTKTALRNGWTTGRWTSVGAGDYYFKFYKAGDGINVTSNNVHMWCD
jgi:hypothetical protein